MIKDFELIIFDWDGTLANSIEWIVECIIEISSELGYLVPSEQACRNIIGLSLGDAMKKLFPHITKQQEQQMVEHYRVKYIAKKITPDDLFIDTQEVLLHLKNAGKCLAVATGKGQSGLDRAMAGTGLGHYFDEMRCANERLFKPEPKMLFEIMEATQIPADKTIMIGDSTIDLEMANKAGVASIGVTTGAHTRDQLITQQPMACVDNLIEIL